MRELLELLEHDARRPVSDLAAMLNRSEYEVEKQIKEMLTRYRAEIRKASDEAKNSGQDMANGLNIHTLCEGVETEEQYRFLRDIGCEYIQGYYYGKPMTLHDLMPHVISKGLTVETPDQRKFYDKAAHEPISVDDEMGFIIDDGEKFEVLFLNAPFRNLCQKMGVKSYDVADLMSKRQDPWSKQIVITANRAKETNETEATFITYEDYYLQVRFK